jgi:hypothetical protein
MKRLFFVFFFIAILSDSFAQKATDALQGNYSLRDRYFLMKSKSQTYGEYKVIKENVLDGVWRILQDSLASNKAAIKSANTNINDLTAQLNQANTSLKEKEQSMAEILHDSTHISVLGIDLAKGTFIGVVAVSLAALLTLLVMIVGRMKLQSKSLSERNLAVKTISSEFEEYKHRAMDKQIKLSRELQDERNRLQSLSRSS